MLFPSEVIRQYLTEFRSIQVDQDKVLLIYVNEKSMNNDLLAFKSLRDSSPLQSLVPYEDPNRYQTLYVLKLLFNTSYLQLIYKHFKEKPTSKGYVDIGSWNPYHYPTDGQLITLGFVDKIFKVRSLVEKKEYKYVFMSNDHTERISDEVRKIVSSTTILPHNELVANIIRSEELTDEHKENFLCKYYMNKFLEIGDKYNISWDIVISQRDLYHNYIDGKYPDLGLVLSVNRDGRNISEMVTPAGNISMEDIENRRMFYAGTDCLYAIELYQTYQVPKIYITVSFDHKYYAKILTDINEYLAAKHINAAEMELVFLPKVYYMDNGERKMFSKSQGNTTSTMSFLTECAFIHNLPLYLNMSKETLEISKETYDLVNRKRKERELMFANESKAGRYSSDAAGCVWIMDRLESIYKFNKIHLFEEIQQFVRSTNNINNIKLYYSIYDRIKS